PLPRGDPPPRVRRGEAGGEPRRARASGAPARLPVVPLLPRGRGGEVAPCRREGRRHPRAAPLSLRELGPLVGVPGDGDVEPVALGPGGGEAPPGGGDRDGGG